MSLAIFADRAPFVRTEPEHCLAAERSGLRSEVYLRTLPPDGTTIAELQDSDMGPEGVPG